MSAVAPLQLPEDESTGATSTGTCSRPCRSVCNHFYILVFIPLISTVRFFIGKYFVGGSTLITQKCPNSFIRSNLAIPKPAEGMLAPISNDAAISSMSEIPHITKGRVKKPDTLLKDNGTSSAR